MADRDISHLRQAQYDGDDSRPMSRKELWVSSAETWNIKAVSKSGRAGMLMRGLPKSL